MKDNDSPSYYSILPAIVRYDNKISDFAKVLFSELTALANKTGKAFPTNNKLAKWFNKSPKTISTTISLLESKKYILVEIERNAKGTFRSITPLVDPLSLGGRKKGNTPNTKTSSPIEENVIPKEYTYNNTTSNSNNNIYIEEEGEEPKKEIPYLLELEQILLLFEELTGRGFRIPPDSKVLRYGAYKKVAAVLRAGYSLEDVLEVIKLKYKDWKDSKKYAIYIRYETLLASVEKFEKYKGELDITKKLGNNNKSSYERSKQTTNKEESLQDRLEQILKQSREEGFI